MLLRDFNEIDFGHVGVILKKIKKVYSQVYYSVGWNDGCSKSK